MEEFARNVALPAATNVILDKIFSFMLDKLPRPWAAAGTRDAHRRLLENLLDSISSAVEEAEGRHIISNFALLAQLQSLIDAKYRGRFLLEFSFLDDVKSTIGDDDDDDVSAVTSTGKRLLALCSPSNAAKRARLILGGGGGAAMTEKSLASVVEELQTLTGDYMERFIELLQGYPRRNRVQRLVTTTLYMDRCVFGRHVETERVVAFLLQPTPTTGLSALAVLGPRAVGKTTLVKHACQDDRVRGHYSHVEWFGIMEVLSEGGQPDQKKFSSGGPEYLTGLRRILEHPLLEAVGQALLVFDDFWPVDETAWAALLTTSKLAEGSKLVFISRDVEFGRTIGTTVDRLVLQPLRGEEYWYYFKAFAFDDKDPRDHPRMAALGREISRRLHTLIDAQVFGDLLRANFDARFWRKVLAALDKSQRVLPCSLCFDILTDFVSVKGWEWVKSSVVNAYPYPRYEIPPNTNLTLQDVLRAAAGSSSRSGLGGGNTKEAIVIQRRPLLYSDGWYAIEFSLMQDL